MENQQGRRLFARELQYCYDIALLKQSRQFPYLIENPQVIIQRVYQHVDEVYELHKDMTVNDFIESYNCQYELEKTRTATYSSYKRAMIEITKKSKKITVYEESIKQLMQIVEKFELNITEKQLELLHIGHELFHLIEYETGKDVSAILQPQFKQTKWRKRKQLEELSEIASYQFSMKFANISVHPRAFDYAILLLEGNDIEAQINEVLTC